MEQIKNAIQNGKTVLGIELGSTRIKAVLRTFGQVFRQATKIWLTTLKINTAKNLQKSVQ